MKEIFKQLVTGIDGETHDVARWLGILAVLHFMLMSSWVVMVQHGEWKPSEYGIGIGALFAAIGAFIKLKENQEPKAAPPAPVVEEK